MRQLQRRMPADDRRVVILDAAVRIARRHGVLYVTHERVSGECAWPTSVSTIWRIVGNGEKLVRATVAHGNLKIPGL